MTTIHPTAIINETAQLGENVAIGAYSVIGPGVVLGKNNVVGPHVVIDGPTIIGDNNKFYQFASIGSDTQDKKFHGEHTELVIGSDNVFREFCTINRGTEAGGGKTIIGNSNWFMAYTHVAHDCRVGSYTIFSNNASLAGHVVVDDYALLSGFSGVHQFCQIGAHSMLAMGTLVGKDVPPFVMIAGPPPSAYGINVVGLKRRGFSEETILTLKRAYKIIYRQGLTIEKALQALGNLSQGEPQVKVLCDFLNRSERGIVR